MDLDRGGAHKLGHFRREQFRHRRLLQTGFAVVAALRGVENEAARGGELRRHVGEAKGDRLMRDDLLPEGFAFLGVGERRLVSRARHAERLRGDADTSAFEVRERDAIALALLAEHQIGGQLHVLEDDLRGVRGALPQFVLEPGDAVAGGVGRHDKGADCVPRRGR